MRRRIFLGQLTVVLVIVVGISLLIAGRGHHLVLGESIEVMPTTAPLIINAVADDQGVTISWIPSQDGTFPIHAYEIFHKNVNGQFERIGEVDAGLTQYLDSNGRKGDTYKLTSSDDQQPPDISDYSDEITATPAQVAEAPSDEPPSMEPNSTGSSAAANNLTSTDNSSPLNSSNLSINLAPTNTGPSQTVVISPTPIPLPAPQVNSNYVPTDLPVNISPQEVVVNNLQDLTKNEPVLPSDTKMSLDDQKVQQVQKSTNLQVVQLETVIVTAKEFLVQPLLSLYSNQTQQLYQHFNQLSNSQKTTTKQACQQQTTDLETSLLNLPEQYQIDLFMGLAHCLLINGQP